MMTQEEYMDVVALRRQGWTITQIAEAVGRHPATVSRWIRAGGPPARREFTGERLVDDRWAKRVDELLRANRELLGTSVFRILSAEGFEGSYPTLVRHLRAFRGPRRRRTPEVSVPIETPPGEEAQADWTDCRDWGERWGLGELYGFGAILSWSRHRFWWFTSSIDRAHTFEGLVRFFEDAGGVPAVCRVDRMGALGQSRGRAFSLHPPAAEFARYHGFAFRACLPGDARRKGKVERPFGELKAAFLAELEALGPPASVRELNERAARWLAETVHPRPHRTTRMPPGERLAAERPLLGPLPRMRFDTARREPRTVAAPYPLVAWEGTFYSVPPALVGVVVEVRQPVASELLEIRYRGEVVATHRVAPGAREPVWDPAHRAAAGAMALSRHERADRHLRAVAEVNDARVELPPGDFEVDLPDLSRYEDSSGEGGAA